ncbi:short-chain dehydrogenase/reductase SDR [Kribbella flavida DSM 17836]|uniref:Short-chain dehydrogenase/reductase SDR n=1 Tax=Kribbella flavida (strain DSM 17836 / JCM 10339 / NBRC 14399) TaxID=479435 RepID=D2PWT9_KRIFD|nr:glucose 1-dehydrogenase [Kribbella flavida]ADB33558.1 short-chain dehydrogenase/reductase SDR [Kribbella flavida DSM 17836]
MTGRLTGKIAVITGAANGIGAATALRLASEDAAVTCVDIDTSALERLGDELSAAGANYLLVAADVATAEGNERAVDETVEAFGGVDILHANAAIQMMGRLPDSAPETWDRLYEVNLRGVMLGVNSVLPHMQHRGGGSIVITASLLGMVGDPEMPVYGAMKGGLRALARSLAAAHGPEGIRVNTVCPGDVDTALLEDFFAYQPDPEDARRRLLDRYPLRRFAVPEDIAHAVLFLGSDEAQQISGIDLVIDGGLLAQIY